MAELSRKEQAQNTEQRIVDATVYLMRNHAFQDIKIQQIVQQAGISIGNFYHHFPHKHSIIIRVMDSQYDVFIQGLQDIPAQPSPANITAIFQKFCHITEKWGADFILEVFAYNIISKDNFLLKPDNPLYHTIYCEVKKLKEAKIFTSADDAVQITEKIMVVFRGFLYEWCLSHKNRPLGQVIEQEVSRYLTLF